MKKFLANQDKPSATESPVVSHNDLYAKSEPATLANDMPGEKDPHPKDRPFAVKIYLTWKQLDFLRSIYKDFDQNADSFLQSLACAQINILMYRTMVQQTPAIAPGGVPPARHENPLMIPPDELPPDSPAAKRLDKEHSHGEGRDNPPDFTEAGSA
jgi:hypothetical protein